MYQKQVSFGEAITLALKKNYCNFSGRASRSEYWWFTLFEVILSLVISVATMGSETVSSIASGLFSLAFLLPNLGITVRRLHDIGRSGWWMLLYWVVSIISACMLVGPLVVSQLDGSDPSFAMLGIGCAILLADIIWWFVWLCKPSVQGDNEYGSEPNMVDEDGNELGEKYSF